MHRIRRFGRLGRVLERIAAENRLDCWRRYVTHDLVLVARAVDGFPGMSRRRHLCHCHIATVATLAHLDTAATAESSDGASATWATWVQIRMCTRARTYGSCSAITSLIKGRLPGAPERRWQNVPLALVHTSSARARPPRCARFLSQPSPRPASCPPCLDCPRVSSRSPLHARRLLQGRPRGRALASTGVHAAGCG